MMHIKSYDNHEIYTNEKDINWSFGPLQWKMHDLCDSNCNDKSYFLFMNRHQWKVLFLFM